MSEDPEHACRRLAASVGVDYDAAKARIEQHRNTVYDSTVLLQLLAQEETPQTWQQHQAQEIQHATADAVSVTASDTASQSASFETK